MATTTEYQYVIDSSDLKNKYDRIQAVISALIDQQILMVGKSGIVSYSLNDGQTVISTTYRNSMDIAKAIQEYTKISNVILSQITGSRVKRLADAQSVQSNGHI
jgi:uncharacterized protein YqgV (UPF0045/DUF77 family)